MNRMYATFDISTSGVKFVVVKVSQNHVDPIFTFFKRVKVMNWNGEIINDLKLIEIVKHAVKYCEKTLDYQVDNVIVNFPMVNCLIKNVKKGLLVNKPLAVDDVKKLINFSQELSGLNDNILLTLIPKSYEYDGKETSIPPIGESVGKLFLNSLIYLGNFKTYYRLLEIFKKAKVNVSNFCLEGYATAYEIANKSYLNDGCIIVDYGAETIKISLFEKNLLIDYRVLKMGSNYINKDLKYFIKDVEEDEIEKLKIRYANLENGYRSMTNDNDEYLFNDSLKTLYSTDGKPLINDDKLQEVVYWRVKETFYKVAQAIAEMTNNNPKYKVIIAGGGSAIKGLHCFLEKENYFINHKLYKSSYIGVKNPIFANAIGIGIYQNLVNYISDQKINSLKTKNIKDRIFNTLNMKIWKHMFKGHEEGKFLFKK